MKVCHGLPLDQRPARDPVIRGAQRLDDDLSAEPLEGCGNAAPSSKTSATMTGERPSSILVAYTDNRTDPETDARPNRDGRARICEVALPESTPFQVRDVGDIAAVFVAIEDVDVVVAQRRSARFCEST